MCGALFFASILDGVVGIDATVGKVGSGPRNRVRRFFDGCPDLAGTPPLGGKQTGQSRHMGSHQQFDKILR